jgi:hypothetical protein
MTHRSTAASSITRRSGALRRSVAGRLSNSIPIESSSNQAINTSNVFSSDSDPDTTFVTNRRKRTASADYDGGPEQSDTDHTF